MSEYQDRIDRWAQRLRAATLNSPQRCGFACVACGHNQLTDRDSSRSFVVVGYGEDSSHLFACRECDQALASPEPVTAAEERDAAIEIAAARADNNIELAAELADARRELEQVRLDLATAQAGRAMWQRIAEENGARLDEMIAGATMLAGHAPGVMVEARVEGARLLGRVIA